MMITIFVYGLDQFVVGRLSKELLENLSNVFEIDEDEINFVASGSMYFHNGVEQTSWNVLVKVNAPERLSVVQEDVAKVILAGFEGYTINIEVQFDYYCEEDHYEKISEDYPRYISETNIVNVEDEYEEEDDDEDEEHHYHEYKEGDGDDEIYMGDIFKDFNNGDK